MSSGSSGYYAEWTGSISKAESRIRKAASPERDGINSVVLRLVGPYQRLGEPNWRWR